MYYTLENTIDHRFAWARVAPSQKEAILALFAYAQTLNHTAERYHEPSMAQLKLAWWQEEIERVFKNQAEHPIGQALQLAVKTYPLNKKAFLAMIEAAQLSLTTQRFETQTQLAQHYQHTGGILHSLIAIVLNQNSLDVETEKYAHTLGVALETIRHIIDTPYYLARQHLYFPAATIETEKMDLSELFKNPQGNENLNKLLKQQADWAREQYQSARNALPRIHQKIQRPGLLYAALRFKQADKIEQEGFRVCEHRVDRSPLSKWWMSVRH